MSTKNLNKTEVKIFVKRHYNSQKEFCKVLNINYNCFKNWLSGNNTLKSIPVKVANHIKISGYDMSLILKNSTYKTSSS